MPATLAYLRGGRLSTVALLFTLLLVCVPAAAVIQLRVQTDLGGLDLELFDTQAPLTVQNFMNYVNRGDYDGTFIHRSVPDFVVQGGGYIFNPEDGGFLGDGTSHIPTDPPVENEPDPVNRPNVRGTIAMAKTSDPDSATSEWFFNLTDNPALDDPVNAGGFTVFGQVTGDGMQVIDDIAAQLRCVDIAPFPTLCGQFPEVPFIGFDGSGTIEPRNLAIVNSIGFDNDADGAIDSLEDAAPNNGDANNDGIPDSTQNHVASFPGGNSGPYVVIEIASSDTLGSLDVLDETFALAHPPATPGLFDVLDFSSGYAGFDVAGIVPGSAVTVSQTLAAGESPDTYYLYGPTPENAEPHWYEFLFDGETGAEINGNLISLHYVDGLRGDADLENANGIVVASPGGPATNLDADGDGVTDAVEDAGPNGGDANNDGTSDSLQGHVASFPDINGDYVLLEVDALLQFEAVTVTNQPPAGAEVLDGVSFSNGYFSFRISGAAAGATLGASLTLPAGASPDSYYIHGPTPDNAEPHWYEFLFDGETGAAISDNIVTMTFVDGRRGDGDLDGANGVIVVDPGGPASVFDSDGDSVPNDVEDGAPNDGDGNNDGISDSLQGHVISFAGSSGVYITLQADQLLQFDTVVNATALLLANPPAVSGFNFSWGLFGFTVRNLDNGAEVTIDVILPEGIAPVTYFKYGPTLGNPVNHWYQFIYDGETGAEFNGNVVTLHFVDGKRGDSDLAVNGEILDPGAPALEANISGASNGSSGCSLQNAGSGPLQAGAWWLLGGLMILLGSRRRFSRRPG